MLALCVISFVLSIKETIEDKPDWFDICVYFLLSIFFVVQVIRAKNKQGVKTMEEKTRGLQSVINEQRKLLASKIGKNIKEIPQVFIPYKEVLEIYENGLYVPDDVMLMWCDDNYGYMTRLSDEAQQKRSGGGGVYYHLSYWGRPHDYLWLTTTQPGLIYNEMKTAYDHNAKRLWIANVHDPKVAAYDLSLFLDMAWNINCVKHDNIQQHLCKWLQEQFGEVEGKLLLPSMVEGCNCNSRRMADLWKSITNM